MKQIEEIWELGQEQIKQDRSLDSAAILLAITEGSKGITASLQKPLWFGIVIASLAVVMFIYNCFFYWANLPIMITILMLLLVSAALIVFLLSQIRHIKRMDQWELNLRDILIYKIKYLNTRYSWALHCVSLSVILTTFTINLSMENSDGIIEIHKIFILSAYYLFVYLLGFGLMKLSLNVVNKQLKNALFNLEEQTLRGLDGELRKHRRITRIITAVLIIFLLTGVVFMLFS